MIFANQEGIKTGTFYFCLPLTIRRLSSRSFIPTGFEDSQTEDQIPALSLTSWVTLGKQCYLSEFHLLKKILIAGLGHN